MAHHLLAISGSLRKHSFNTALLRAFEEHAPEGVTVEFAEIGNLPLFNEDAENDFPEVVTELKNKILRADGILVATPEYNRGMPGVLKNAIDWTSRPYGQNAWVGKPVYVMGASSGPIAAALAQYNAKQVFTYLNAFVMGQPEFYCGVAGSKFDESGTLIDDATREHVVSGLQAFLAYIDRVRA